MRRWIQPLNRRRFLSQAGLLPIIGNVKVSGLSAASSAREKAAPGGQIRDNIYTRLGVHPVINALAMATHLGGTLMPPEVVAAMEEAAKYFVSLPELHENGGQRIAQLIGVEAALITTGAAGAITLGTAACVAGNDPQKIHQLPDTTGMKNEIIMQKSHWCGYETQMRIVGTRIIEIETREQLEAAINAKTAMLFFLNKAHSQGQIRREDWLAVGKSRGIPTFNDAAADLPPKERLSEYVRMGFDLVAFSGGKGLLGPQCSGLLLGRKDLIDAARINGSPWGGTIGRGMKVGKEEIIGILAAVERYLKVDHEAERRELEFRIREISQSLARIPGVRTESYIPEIANQVPHLAVGWDSHRINLTSEEASERLLKGDPPVQVGPPNLFRPDRGREPSPGSVQGLTVCVWTLRAGEAKVVAQRLREVLTSPAGKA